MLLFKQLYQTFKKQVLIVVTFIGVKENSKKDVLGLD